MKLKICGMKYRDNIEQLVALQPDYMGLIFYEKSPRFADQSLPEIPVKTVGVFVDASKDYILSTTDRYQLYAVQLHGKESPEFCSELKMERPGLKIIKVFSVSDTFDFSVLTPYETVCDFYLFDTKGKLPGGNGYTFDWSLLKDYPSQKPYFLSGGIGPEQTKDIQDFLNSTQSQYCHALDLNSRFEIKPGLKDIDKLTLFKQSI